MADDWESMVLVGRVARPHGLRGQVVVNPETDFVEARFGIGAMVWALVEGRREALTIGSALLGGRRPVVGFEGVTSVELAERLSGLELRVPEEALVPLGPGTYYHHELVGCEVETADGASIGVVTRVDGGLGGSLLVVEGSRGEVLIPLTEEVCREIDVSGRRIRVEPTAGLLELNEKKSHRQ